MKNYLIILVFLLSINIHYAQDSTKYRVEAVSRSYNNKIVLRLFPIDRATISTGSIKGYRIQRADILGNDLSKLYYSDIRNSPSIRLTEDSAMAYIESNRITDKVEREMAGLAFGLTETKAIKPIKDVLTDGLISLREHQQDESMKLFMLNVAVNRSKLAAKVLGLWVEDDQVILGKTYAYRIKINDEENDWFYIKVKCENFNPNYLLNNNSILLAEGDTKVDFRFAEEEDFYAFNVDRASFKTGDFKRMNNEPIIKITPHNTDKKTDYIYSDSGLVNYNRYFYKVWVNTPFGDELLLAEFSGMPGDKTAPSAPYLKSVKHIRPTEVELIWETNGLIVPDLIGFNVKRSESIDGVYKVITRNSLSKSTFNYIDKDFIKEGSNYYIVEAIDTAGNISQSFPSYLSLIDSIPPKKPEILSAVIDSFGKVLITMKPNLEKDFMGYELQKANAKDHEFSIVYQTFRDSLGFKIFNLNDSTTLNTLTKKIYYKVIAFDNNFNQSISSEIVELIKRDTIPPVPAILTDFNVNDTSILLYFVNSSSEDAVNNYLLRREIGENLFDTIFLNSDLSIQSYKDTKIVSGMRYEYSMFSKDATGLNSQHSRSLIIGTILNNKFISPIIKGNYTKISNSVSINILNGADIKEKNVKVEISKRHNRKSKWYIIGVFDLENNISYTDHLAQDKEIIYIARFIGENGKASNYSKPFEMLIE